MRDLHLRNGKRSCSFSLSLMRRLSVTALSHKPSPPPSGASATATPASAPRGGRGGCSASASTIQRGTTARDVTLFTRTDPGPGRPGTPPTSAWVSIRLLAGCHTRLRTKNNNCQRQGWALPSGNIKTAGDDSWSFDPLSDLKVAAWLRRCSTREIRKKKIKIVSSIPVRLNSNIYEQ